MTPTTQPAPPQPPPQPSAPELPADPAAPRPVPWARLLAVLGVAAVFALLVHLHLGNINGSDFHRWDWQVVGDWRLVVGMGLAGLVFLAAQLIRRRSGGDVYPIALLMLALLGMQLAAQGLRQGGPSGRSIVRIVQHPLTTSYFSDAQSLIRGGWGAGRIMERYPQIMPRLRLHTRVKPPGPVLYHYATSKLFGAPDRAALAGGLLIGLIATLTVPAVYVLVRNLLHDRDSAFCAASFMALLPAMVGFFPMFDQWYAAISSVLIILWIQALVPRPRRLGWVSPAAAAAFGLLLALQCLMAYNMLVIGAFLVGWAIFCLWTGGSAVLGRVVRGAAVAIGAFLAANILLWWASGYEPRETFRTALALQAEHYTINPRPWPHTIPTDLTDFAMGCGWIGALLAAFGLHRLWRADRRLAAVGLLCVLQIAVVAASGLLRCETARVWLLLQPLVMVLVGYELARWPAKEQLTVYAALWLLTVLIVRNMTLTGLA